MFSQMSMASPASAHKRVSGPARSESVPRGMTFGTRVVMTAVETLTSSGTELRDFRV